MKYEDTKRRPWRRQARRLLVCAALAWNAGCGGSDDPAAVSGTVTLDGQPLASGQIRFAPIDGQGPTAGGPIAHGAYDVPAPPGEKRVEISAPKVVGKQRMYGGSDGPSVDVVQELLPPRYNVQSELRATVGEADVVLDFELRSK